MSPQQKNTIHERSLAELNDASYRLSRDIIQMTTKAGSGHPSSSLSAIDILVALYLGGFMRYDPLLPHWADRDRFILSKGHAAPGLYAILAEAGFFDHALLWYTAPDRQPAGRAPQHARPAGG